MKKLLIALLCLPLLAYGQEPANVEKIRREFMDGLKAEGYDPKKCELKYFAADGQHYIRTECETLPYMCLFLVHPTEVAVQPISCVDNPKYKAPGKKI